MARNIGVNFNGKHIIHPGAYSRINANALGLTGSNATRRVVFIGSSEGGEPGVLHWFSNPTDARDVLRGGDLMIAGELAWAPSGDAPGASDVGFLRVEGATQGAISKEGLTLTSIDYGAHINKIQAKLEAGTLTGSKRLTAHSWVDNRYEIYDNIGPIFDVQYKGVGVYADITIEVNEVTGKSETLRVKVGADKATAVDAIVYDLTSGQFDVVQKIVSDLNDHPDFEASMVVAGNKNIPTQDLDELVATSIMTKYNVKALKGDLLHQTQDSRLFVATFDGEFPSNFSYEYLTGGTDGIVPLIWTDKFNLLYGEGVDLIVPLTASESIHAECAQFIEFQSNEERNEMRGIYGGALAESVETVVGRALTLNSSRAIVAYPGITRSIGSSNNEVKKLAPYFTAALIAGKIAGVPIGEPVTLDYVNLIGLERVPTSSEINRLIEGGVTTLEFVRQRNRKGFRIAQGVTTYQVDGNPVYREIAMGMMSDALSRELRERLESKFAGGKGLKMTTALVKNEVQSFLDDKVRDEWIVDYRRTVDVLLTGDAIYVNYEAQPVNSVNFILITTNYYQEPITG